MSRSATEMALPAAVDVRASAIISVKCLAYSVGRPQEAGSSGTHFG
jgi:hypothetical protein